MQVNVVHHYLSRNPYSSLPIVCLAVSGKRRDVSALMQAQADLREIAGHSKDADRFCASLSAPSSGCSDQEEFWIRAWFAALLSWSGLIQIDKPEQPIPDMRERSDDLSCQLFFNCFRDDFRHFVDVVKWTLECWSYLLANPDRQQGPSFLQAKLQSLHRPAIKESFVAMAKYLASVNVYVSISYSRGQYWLHAGTGLHHRQFSQKMTSATSALGLQDSKDKLVAKKLLLSSGLPVASGGVAMSFVVAKGIAEKLGYPLVLKPVALDQGIGVITGIQGETELQQAWKLVSEHSPRILVEKHIPGGDFRFLLVNGRLIASLERIPGGVVGDGQSTIEALVARENQRRMTLITVESGVQLRMLPLALDDEAHRMLAAQGLGVSSVPAADAYVRLRYTANFSAGGSVRECSAEIHDFNVFLLEKVAATFRLDIVGIDVIAPSMDVPLTASGGVICEVNGMPGVLPHMLAEPSRSLMAEMADLLLSPRRQVPVVAVHGRGASSFIQRLEQAVLPHQPQLITASRGGLRQGGYLLRRVDASKLFVQMNALQDLSSGAYLFELNGKELVTSGLACPTLDLLILAESEDDPLLESTRDWLCSCASTVIELPRLDSDATEDQVGLALKAASGILSSSAD